MNSLVCIACLNLKIQDRLNERNISIKESIGSWTYISYCFIFLPQTCSVHLFTSFRMIRLDRLESALENEDKGGFGPTELKLLTDHVTESGGGQPLTPAPLGWTFISHIDQHSLDYVLLVYFVLRLFLIPFRHKMAAFVWQLQFSKVWNISVKYMQSEMITVFL